MQEIADKTVTKEDGINDTDSLFEDETKPKDLEMRKDTLQYYFWEALKEAKKADIVLSVEDIFTTVPTPPGKSWTVERVSNAFSKLKQMGGNIVSKRDNMSHLYYYIPSDKLVITPLPKTKPITPTPVIQPKPKIKPEARIQNCFHLIEVMPDGLIHAQAVAKVYGISEEDAILLLIRVTKKYNKKVCLSVHAKLK